MIIMTEDKKINAENTNEPKIVSEQFKDFLHIDENIIKQLEQPQPLASIRPAYKYADGKRTDEIEAYVVDYTISDYNSPAFGVEFELYIPKSVYDLGSYGKDGQRKDFLKMSEFALHSIFARQYSIIYRVSVGKLEKTSRKL